MRNARTILTLSPTHLSLSLDSGARVIKVELDPARWGTAWLGGLRALDAPLAELLARALRLKGPIQIQYHSPDAIAELSSLPLSLAEAERAARLRIRETLSGEATPIHVRVLSQLPHADEAIRTTMLVTADTAASVESVTDWAARAGIHKATITPAKGAILASAIAQAMQNKNKSGVVLWLGEHCAALAGFSAGRVTYARIAELGTDMLREAFARGLRAAGVDDDAQIASMPATIGIPRRERVLDEAKNIRGDKVLPLLQPILQRYAIELKQTLRFGLPENEAIRASVTLAGPGALVPGLADALSGLIDTNVVAAPSTGAMPGKIIPAVFLESAGTIARRTRHRLITGAVCGVAIALSAIAGDYHFLNRSLRAANSAIASNRPGMLSIESDTRESDRLRDATERAAKFGAAMFASVGTRPSVAAGLTTLTEMCPRELRLTEITFGHNNDGATLTVRGSSIPTGPVDPLATLMGRLKTSALVRSVNLLSSRRLPDESIHETQFTLAVTLETLDPEDRLHAPIAHSGEVSR